MNDRDIPAVEADEPAGWSQQAATEYAQWCAEQDDEPGASASVRQS